MLADSAFGLACLTLASEDYSNHFNTYFLNDYFLYYVIFIVLPSGLILIYILTLLFAMVLTCSSAMEKQIQVSLNVFFDIFDI